MKIPFIIWNDSMSVANPELDGHHRKLIQIVNDLHDQLRNGTVDPILVFDTVFGEMLDYADYHFKREEELLRLCNYQDFNRHQAVHGKYIDIMQRIKENRGQHLTDQEFPAKVLKMLKSWWTNHIMKQDKEYTACINPEVEKK